MIISKTPVRISFFGGGTDYPIYYSRKKGAVLGTTINKYIYLSLNKLSKFFDYKIRIGYSKSELAQRVEDIKHPSVRECLKHKNVDTCLDVHIFADLPAKTGLGSSSSFTVGLLNALYALEGKRASKQALAKEACYIEQKLIQENVGSQDQYHAAFGGFNVFEFNENNVTARPLLISQNRKDLLHDHMMLFYTGISRFANSVLKEQCQNTKSKSKDRYLERIYDMVFEAEDILTNNPEKSLVKSLGQLMNEGWENKKQLSSQVSNEKIDHYYALAKKAGAYGGKLCGAGAGGFLLLFTPIEKKPLIRKNLRDLLEVDCNFEQEGSSIIYYKN